jgi:ABC-type polysaccharide/polyol phosphate export permease
MIFVLPVFYSVHSVENASLDLIYSINPIAGSMDYLRACFSPKATNPSQLVMWLVQSLVWVMIGVVVIRKMEKSVADKV